MDSVTTVPELVQGKKLCFSSVSVSSLIPAPSLTPTLPINLPSIVKLDVKKQGWKECGYTSSRSGPCIRKVRPPYERCAYHRIIHLQTAEIIFSSSLGVNIDEASSTIQLVEVGYREAELREFQRFFAKQGYSAYLCFLRSKRQEILTAEAPEELCYSETGYPCQFDPPLLVVRGGVNHFVDSLQLQAELVQLRSEKRKNLSRSAQNDRTQRVQLNGDELAPSKTFLELREKLNQLTASSLRTEAHLYADIPRRPYKFPQMESPKRIVGVRLGSSLPLRFTFGIVRSQAPPAIFELVLHHGDLYFLSEELVLARNKAGYVITRSLEVE